MIYSDNVLNILAAKSYRGIGRAWIVKNMRSNYNINRIVELLNKTLKISTAIDEFTNIKKTVKNRLSALEGYIDGAVAIGDDYFTEPRGSVKDSELPILLFYRGNLKLLDRNNKNISVIGLLNPDENIERIERKIVAELVKRDITVISGLALGCDTIAHKQTLESSGKTVAILPGSLDEILPASNTDLANKIVANGGLLISEYYEKAKSRMEFIGRYQERDRLQALFCDGIILSASYAKNDEGNDSGSRLAMEYALNYAIKRAVINMNLNEPQYELNRRLLAQDSNIISIDQENFIQAIDTLTAEKTPAKYKQLDLSAFL